MLNKVQLIGRLGGDPEVRYTKSGSAFCNFSIATSKKYKGPNGEPKEETEWHRIITWERLAEVCGEYLHKGSLVFIEGEIKSETYADKEGVNRTAFKIKAYTMLMLDSKKERDNAEKNKKTDIFCGSGNNEGDIPF